MKHTDEWARGDTAQRRFAEILRGYRLCVLPTYAFEDVTPETKAPVMLAPQQDSILVTPDLLALRDGWAQWCEVKSKSVPTWYRRKAQWEHGCDRDVFDEYEVVQHKSGIDVQIVVHELSTPEQPEVDSPLRLSGLWLSIRLNDARRVGDWRTDWPGGAAQPNRRGRRGRGGWLWPRNAMRMVREAQSSSAREGR